MKTKMINGNACSEVTRDEFAKAVCNAHPHKDDSNIVEYSSLEQVYGYRVVTGIDHKFFVPVVGS